MLRPLPTLAFAVRLLVRIARDELGERDLGDPGVVLREVEGAHAQQRGAEDDRLEGELVPVAKPHELQHVDGEEHRSEHPQWDVEEAPGHGVQHHEDQEYGDLDVLQSEDRLVEHDGGDTGNGDQKAQHPREFESTDEPFEFAAEHVEHREREHGEQLGLVDERPGEHPPDLSRAHGDRVEHERREQLGRDGEHEERGRTDGRDEHRGGDVERSGLEPGVIAAVSFEAETIHGLSLAATRSVS